MKKTKFLALILCLSFLCTLLLPATAYADDPPRWQRHEVQQDGDSQQ